MAGTKMAPSNHYLMPAVMVCLFFMQACGGIPPAAPGGPSPMVEVRLRWIQGGAAPGPRMSTVPVDIRLRLIVDYPEDHDPARHERQPLVDMDFLPGRDTVLDVAPGAGRRFLAAAYGTGLDRPSYKGSATADIAGYGDDIVTIYMEPASTVGDTPPTVSLSGDSRVLAGNLVSLDVAAADLDQDVMTLQWKVESEGEPIQDPGELKSGKLEFKPPAPGVYLVTLKAGANGVEGEPAYSVVTALDCSTAEDAGMACDTGTTCKEDGVCR